MRIITVEEHFADAGIIEADARFGDPSGMRGLPEDVRRAYDGMRFTGDALLDRDGARLAFMDAQKVDVQVLSYTAPVSDMVPAKEAVQLCRQANDILATVVEAHPDRFAAFATLPMANPEAAADELERCVREHGFVGALITGTRQGEFYDDPAFFRIFAKAAELDVPISWHPEFPDAKVQTHYFISDNYPLLTGMQFATAGFERRHLRGRQGADRPRQRRAFAAPVE